MNEMLMEQHSAPQNPFTLLRAKCQSLWRRIVWQIFLKNAETTKRGMDIVLSFAALVLLAPLFFLIGILIKLEDHGPVFFCQRRVGKDGRVFVMYKFRSMCVDAEARLAALLLMNQHKDGITFKIKNDPRLTRVGKWLRMSSLDEFPQFYNVLIANMSLVGPRPSLPREVKLYSMAERYRLAVKPGLTCFWQIGGRSEIDFTGQVALDIKYIVSQTFWGDIKILAKTIPAVLFGKGAC
jgi:lipopolysaccharide/colanic/teichoic acid biosynthesis glycosyltransferase